MPGNLHCLEDGCKHNRKDMKDMIQCSHCWEWFHLSCMDMDPKTECALFSCQLCRQMPRMIRDILKEIRLIKDELKSTKDENKTIRDNFNTTATECASLKTENQLLRDRVTEMNSSEQRTAWQGFQKTKHLLVGSSIIRDIAKAPECQDDLEVVCLPGGKISDVTKQLQDRQDKGHKYDIVSVQVGSNDCDSNEEVTAILEQYKELVNKAKSVSNKVTVSNVLPRHDKDSVIDKLQLLNSGMDTMSDDQVNVISHENFYLRDGKPNDGYFLRDKVHLTPQGTNSLINDLNLDGKVTYTRRNNKQDAPNQGKGTTEGRDRLPSRLAHIQQRPQQQRYVKQRSVTVTGNGHATRSYQLKRTSEDHERYHGPTTDRASRQYQSRSEIKVRCYNCGEDGHVSDVCFHGKPVVCDECGVSGHKRKWCHLY